MDASGDFSGSGGSDSSGGGSSFKTDDDCSADSSEDQEIASTSDGENSQLTRYECSVCGRKLRKPSLLKQHLRCHSKERPFCCPVDACTSNYKSEDHLKRHLKNKHDGENLSCSWPGCIYITKDVCSFERHKKLHNKKGNLLRHRDKSLEEWKKHVCKEENCGKTFRYPSQLRYHQETHHGEMYIDVICSEPGCNERFDHPSDLAEHTRNAHKYVFCEVCGKTCMREKIKRHYQTHEKKGVNRERIRCPYPQCSLSYLQENNLRKHIKVVHLKRRPYPCSNADCGKSFAYRHVRDNHERSVHVPGDFVAEDLKMTKKNRKANATKRKTIEKIEDMFLKPGKKRPRAKSGAQN